MSDRMRPIPIGKLLDGIFSEYFSSGAVFGVSPAFRGDPARAVPLPGGGAEAGPPRRPPSGCRTTTEYPQAAPPAWRHPFPKPPLANRDVSKRKWPPCVLDPDT